MKRMRSGLSALLLVGALAGCGGHGGGQANMNQLANGNNGTPPGQGGAGLPGGGGVVQKDGSLAVCGCDPNDGLGAVYRVDSSGTTTLIGKGGALTTPTGLGMDGNGTLLVSDAGTRSPRAQLVSVTPSASPAKV